MKNVLWRHQRVEVAGISTMHPPLLSNYQFQSCTIINNFFYWPKKMGQHQFQSLIIQKAPDKKEYADDDDGHADDGDDDREQDMVGRSWERHIFFQNFFKAF